jgi:hypothetical protein
VLTQSIPDHGLNEEIDYGLTSFLMSSDYFSYDMPDF